MAAIGSAAIRTRGVAGDVSTYILQHPGSMEYTTGSLEWLRSAVAAALRGEVDAVELRRGAARAGKPGGRVRRVPGDALPRRNVARWTTTVAGVIAGGDERYAERVRAWAQDALHDLETSES